MKKICNIILILACMLLCSCTDKGVKSDFIKDTSLKITRFSYSAVNYDELTVAPSKENPLTLKFGFSTDENDPRVIAGKKIKELVEKNTEGAIKIELYPSNALGGDTALISGIYNKTVDLTVSSAGNFAVYSPKIGVSALPFLFSSFEDAWKFIDSKTVNEINADLENYNMHVLAYFDNGFRCITTSEKIGPIDSIDKLKGLEIRTSDNAIVMETLSALGASPKVLPFGKLYDALKSGEFNAQENPIPIIYNNKMYEVQKYLSITNHSYDAMPLVIRKDIWGALTPELQNVISEAAQKAQTLNRSLVQQQTNEYSELLKQKGMIIVTPNLEPFKEKTASVISFFKYVFGKELTETISSQLY